MDDAAVEGRTSLWRLPAMRALVGVTVLGFTSFCLTLASVPAYAVRGGAGETTAGLVTTVFLLVTIAGQGFVPAATARFGVGPVLAAGLVALGAPSPLYAVGNGLGWLAGISAVRGVGFAVLTVLGSVLAAHAAPAERRGEAIGLYGLAIAVPNVVAVPAGVALVLNGHPGWLAWLAASPLLALPLLPGLVRASGGPSATPREAGSSRSGALAAVPPSVVLFVVTLAGGGVLTFLPIQRPDGPLATVSLLLFGVTAALGRWRAGLLADRTGTRILLAVAFLAAAGGLLVLAVGLAGSSAGVVVGCALLGAGYGAVQNLTLLAAFARAGDRATTAASAVWNACFDGGTGVGAVVVGVLAVGLGPAWTDVLIAAAVALTLPLALVSTRRPGVASTN